MFVLNAPGRMPAIHPSRETPLAVFAFRDARANGFDRHDPALRKRIVAEAYAGVGWRAPELVETYEKHPAPFLDPLRTVRLDNRARGRVALLGDAESATALLGDGSSLAFAGAHTLAEALAATPGDHARAFRAYEAHHRREVRTRQRRVNLVAALMSPPHPRGTRGAQRHRPHRRPRHAHRRSRCGRRPGSTPARLTRPPGPMITGRARKPTPGVGKRAGPLIKL
jgi:2-polyprenyl-6-methoxyphenol hydroxylase-like FAD-dependent oxidoreductase